MTREWLYHGEGWWDYWTSSCLRCMIVRHPRHDAGYHMIWIDGECIAKADDLAFAKWKAHNYLEGTK